MVNVVYKINSYEVRGILKGLPDFKKIKDDEDMIFLYLWNKGSDSLGYPKIDESEENLLKLEYPINL